MKRILLCAFVGVIIGLITPQLFRSEKPRTDWAIVKYFCLILTINL